MTEKRKAFHFDLDEGKLKRHYPSENPAGYKNAWTKIRSFMETNGFMHTQYSGYESRHGMTYFDAFTVIENLQDALPWFRECARVATVTEIGRQYDALEHLNNCERPKEEPVNQRDVDHISLASAAQESRRSSEGLEGHGHAQPPKTRDER